MKDLSILTESRSTWWSWATRGLSDAEVVEGNADAQLAKGADRCLRLAEVVEGS